nr:hypothetical protein [Tanacetum cinerariifolium]
MKLQQEEHAAQISTPSLKCLVFYDNDDDEYSIQYTEYLKNSSNAITTSPPVLPIEDPKVLEDIECKDSYDPNLDESTFLVTPLSDSNEDKYFNPGDDVELLLHHDPSIPKMSVASILEGFTNEPPLKENDDLFDLESKNDECKRILYDAQIDDLMSEDKIFDPGVYVKFFSQTFVSLPFEDRHYLFFTYVV